MQKRDKLVDCLKGYACFLVVFGHVIMGIRKSGIAGGGIYGIYLEEFIWTFHVALFMFLSGYVYNITGEWSAKGSRKNFLIHKFLNLGIPYLVFSAIYIIINSNIAGVNNKNALIDILYLWKTPVAQYWFIYALLGLFTLFTVLSGTLRSWQITLTLSALYYLAPIFGVSFGSFGASFSMALVFGLGASVPSLIIDRQKTIIKIIIILFQIFFVSFFVISDLCDLTCVKQISQILGITASIAFVSLLARIQIVEKIFLFICKYSFPIYLLHTIFTAGIRIILFKMGIVCYFIHVLAGIAFGLAIPTITAYLSDKFLFIDFFFYPSKNIKRIKGR